MMSLSSNAPATRRLDLKHSYRRWRLRKMATLDAKQSADIRCNHTKGPYRALVVIVMVPFTETEELGAQERQCPTSIVIVW